MLWQGIKRALRWIDGRLTDNVDLYGEPLLHKPVPLIVRHPMLGARIVTPLNQAPKPQLHSKDRTRKE